ncbi:hypothetical protein FQA39_LY03674 [Lamprigera yunnana]|nr:hypothetical protein FQA39_LY03674 [Lamprigera yunnana]
MEAAKIMRTKWLKPLRKSNFVTFGSPLIDLVINVTDTFLEKFDLNHNDAVALQNDNVLFEEVEKLMPKYVIGGCALNTARALKKVLENGTCTVVGAVGDDDYCKYIKNQLDEDTVGWVFVTLPTNTGRCAVLVNGNHRSLCTDLGASKYFTVENLQSEEIWKVVQNAHYFYLPGFFLSVSVECVTILAQHTFQKFFSLNLSAPFIVERYKDQILDLLPYVDILFGNETEVKSLAKALGWEYKDLSEMLLRINALNVRSKSRVTVITRGPKSVLMAHDNNVAEFLVEELEQDKIKDTNGAGDAFVGGFLANFIMGKSLGTCVLGGIDIARRAIQHNGCLFGSNALAEWKF